MERQYFTTRCVCCDKDFASGLDGPPQVDLGLPPRSTLCFVWSVFDPGTSRCNVGGDVGGNMGQYGASGISLLSTPNLLHIAPYCPTSHSNFPEGVSLRLAAAPDTGFELGADEVHTACGGHTLATHMNGGMCFLYMVYWQNDSTDMAINHLQRAKRLEYKKHSDEQTAISYGGKERNQERGIGSWGKPRKLPCIFGGWYGSNLSLCGLKGGAGSGDQFWMSL